MTVSPTRLYVPPRTRLETVWRVGAPFNASWQVWTATADRNAPFEQMLGTFLYLHADGSAERVTLRPDQTIEQVEVMPCVGA